MLGKLALAASALVTANAQCNLTGYFYNPPNMAGTARSVEASADECQRRCATTIASAGGACVHFQYWPNGGCHLAGENSTLTKATCPASIPECSGTLAMVGPPNCLNTAAFPDPNTAVQGEPPNWAIVGEPPTVQAPTTVEPPAPPTTVELVTEPPTTVEPPAPPTTVEYVPPTTAEYVPPTTPEPPTMTEMPTTVARDMPTVPPMPEMPTMLPMPTVAMPEMPTLPSMPELPGMPTTTALPEAEAHGFPIWQWIVALFLLASITVGILYAMGCCDEEKRRKKKSKKNAEINDIEVERGVSMPLMPAPTSFQPVATYQTAAPVYMSGGSPTYVTSGSPAYAVQAPAQYVAQQ